MRGASLLAHLFLRAIHLLLAVDGTALYEATAVLFIAQVHGVELGFIGTIVVAITATLAAVGAPAIPSGTCCALPDCYTAHLRKKQPGSSRCLWS